MFFFALSVRTGIFAVINTWSNCSQAMVKYRQAWLFLLLDNS